MKTKLICPKCGCEESQVHKTETLTSVVYNHAEVFLAVACAACGCRYWDILLIEAKDKEVQDENI